MSTTNQPSRRRRQKPKKEKKGIFFSSFFKLLLVVGLFAAVIGIGIAGGTLYGWIDTAEQLNIKDFSLDFTSFVYYIDNETGEPVELERLHGTENRVWVDLSQIPKHMQDACIAIEDQRFRQHPGFDLKRTVHATLHYFLGKVGLKNDPLAGGGSTLTQQLIKNLTNEKDVEAQRKVQEIWRAFHLDKKLSKDQILELYLNTIHLGQGSNGVQAASNTYFGKDVSELSLAEAASIIGITQYPSLYNPFLNPEKNKEKQELILKKMLELGYIDQAQYDEAVNEKLAFKKGTEKERTSKQSYFVDQVISDVLDDLVKEKKYTRQLASKMLYTGGLKIYATIDPEVQNAMDKFYADEDFWKSNKFATFKDGNIPESAMLIMDPYTGQVKGMAGGRGQKTANRTLNRATQALRQPGSSIKSIGVYAPAIEYGYLTPGSIIDDVPTLFKDGSKSTWVPRNYDGKFMGLTTARKAIERSRNIPAVKVLEKVGIDKSFEFLQKNLGITTLVEREKRADGEVYSDKFLSCLALGGLTDGISVMEMTAAYVPFVNRGIYTRPYTYTKVLNHEGKVILEKTKESHVAMSEQTAFLMTKMMEGVVIQGTGTAARLSNNMPAAGKTGTTSEFRDKWFAGYSPYYVGCVWYGFDKPENMHTLTNGGLQARANPGAVVWGAVMNEIHKGMEAKQFVQPRDIVKATICRDSGLKPNEYCYKDPRGSRVYTEYFKKGTEPTKRCNVHVLEKIDTANNLLATEYCPPEQVEERVFIVRPEPYVPIKNQWGTPILPQDAQYELPAEEYCNEHGPEEDVDRDLDRDRDRDLDRDRDDDTDTDRGMDEEEIIRLEDLLINQ